MTISTVQYFQNYRFKDNNNLSKYLNNLKHLEILTNKHDKRGTYWDFTEWGLMLFEKLMMKYQIDNIPLVLFKEMKEELNLIKTKLVNINRNSWNNQLYG